MRDPAHHDRRSATPIRGDGHTGAVTRADTVRLRRGCVRVPPTQRTPCLILTHARAAPRTLHPVPNVGSDALRAATACQLCERRPGMTMVASFLASYQRSTHPWRRRIAQHRLKEPTCRHRKGQILSNSRDGRPSGAFRLSGNVPAPGPIDATLASPLVVATSFTLWHDRGPLRSRPPLQPSPPVARRVPERVPVGWAPASVPRMTSYTYGGPLWQRSGKHGHTLMPYAC